MPAIMRTPPGAEAKRQSMALHVLLTAVYILPLGLLGMVGLPRPLFLQHLWVAWLTHVLLFGPALNTAIGLPFFYVSQTALYDRALHWLALRLGWPAQRVQAVVWLLTVGGTYALLILYWE